MSLWLLAEPLVLASKSAVRRAVLEAAGIPVEAHPADVDEREIEARATGGAGHATDVAMLLAQAKALAVAARMPGRIVVGADQTLALGDRRFTKPLDRAGARAQLDTLRGATHGLHSGFAVVRDGRVLHAGCETAWLTMRNFSDDFLERYLDAADAAVTTSVGGYQLERIGIHLFGKIDGDHFTILGLPLLPLLDVLRQHGCLP
jgi:nucleoside triphosphate pyrophosphatase